MNLRGFLSQAWSTVRGWFVAPAVEAPAVVEAPTNLEALQPVPPPSLAMVTSRPTPRKIPFDPSLQELSFIHVADVLEQLPRCRDTLRRLKRFDRDAYAFHKQFGARLVPRRRRDRLFLGGGRLRESVLQTLPGAGLFYFKDAPGEKQRLDRESDDPTISGYSYFTKVDRKPWDLEKISGDDVRALYDVTFVFDDDKITAGYSFHAVILADGHVRLLKTKRTTAQRLPRGGILHHSSWDYHPMLYEHYNDRKGHNAKIGPTAEAFGAELFSLCINAYDATNVGFQIIARRPHGAAVAFSVPASRAPTFFRDREIEAASDGRRQRIFHAVEEHTRTLASGRVVTVAAHYRGARKFTWKGESIRIDPPEQAARFMDVTAVEGPDATDDDAMTMGEFGGRLVRRLDERADKRGGYQDKTKTGFFGDDFTRVEPLGDIRHGKTND
jgi:hypothetical protein